MFELFFKICIGLNFFIYHNPQDECILLQCEQMMVWYAEQKVMAGHCVLAEYKCVADETAKYVIFRSYDFSVISL